MNVWFVLIFIIPKMACFPSHLFVLTFRHLGVVGPCCPWAEQQLCNSSSSHHNQLPRHSHSQCCRLQQLPHPNRDQHSQLNHRLQVLFSQTDFVSLDLEMRYSNTNLNVRWIVVRNGVVQLYSSVSQKIQTSFFFQIMWWDHKIPENVLDVNSALCSEHSWPILVGDELMVGSVGHCRLSCSVSVTNEHTSVVEKWSVTSSFNTTK